MFAVARGDLPLAERGSAAGAEVVEDLLVRQDEKQFFADRHGLLALFAVERRGAEAFELLHGFQKRGFLVGTMARKIAGETRFCNVAVKVQTSGCARKANCLALKILPGKSVIFVRSSPAS